MAVKLRRSSRNPILEPTSNWWESRLVCNPAVVHLDGRIHLVYTAKGEDDVARLGYARLRGVDEVEERLPYPIFQPEEWFEVHGVEDPRITVIDGEAIMFYACKEREMARIAVSTIRAEDFARRRWAWSRHRLLLPVLVGVHNRNAVLFPRRIDGRYVMLHRPMWMSENVWMSYSYDLKHWYNHKVVLEPRPGSWDDAKIGAAGPPIELEDYWLLIYHGVEASTWTYRLGYVLLDKERPDRVVYRCDEPILEPIEPYEREGVTPNVVFSCGHAVVDGVLHVYYGAADRVVCLASAPLKDFLSEL
ncbi:glycosidase [Candidatus Geothermarchaeota archaeon ex4572_27]|nr:MAG: glycosidase [Candidatus Geothermarchaeota archaeon ex4572_27]